MNDLANFPSPHCHVQSLDTGSTVEAFVAREVELGTGTITATDHGSLAACRDIYDLGRKKQLTPILGLEAYFRDDDCPILQRAGAVKDAEGKLVEFMKYAHVTLHMMDQAAYEACSVILSRADARAEQHGQERKQLFSWADMEALGATNTTITSGCLIGMVQRHLMERDDGPSAVAYYERLRALAPGRFYVEVFPHDCSRNYENRIILTLEGGERAGFRARKDRYKGKTIRVSGEEVKADQLVLRKEWGELQSVKHYHTWHDREPKRIIKVEHIQGFVENECRPWAGTSDIQAATNRFMLLMAERYGDPVLISDDAHYAVREDKDVQDVRLAQAGDWRFWGHYHRQSSAEAFAYFHERLGIDETQFRGWVDNNRAWAERFKGFRFHTPASLPTKFYPSDTLRHCGELINRHGRMRWDDPRYLERLHQEIALLHENGTIDLLPYLFLAEESIRQYTDRGKLPGPGRGSAAGLLLAYLLRITQVDPIRYELSLERFLTLDRIKAGTLPDIDLDFPGREILVGEDGNSGWLRERFGDHVAQISTDMTLKVRAACKDVCRMFHQGTVPPDAEQLTGRFSQPPMGIDDKKHVFGYRTDEGKDIPGSITYDQALREFIARYPQEWEIVQRCLGLARGKSRHASAFVIMNEPIMNRIPTTTIGGVLATQMTAKAVEAMGGIKMDFLVVNSLRDISDCVRMIQERSEVPIPAGGVILPERGLVLPAQIVPHAGRVYDVWDLPDDDTVYREIIGGQTTTVFQFGTPGAVGWLKQFDGSRPDGRPAIASISDLAVFTALDRPGPLDAFVADPEHPGQQHNMLVEYAHRVRGKAPSSGVLPVMERLLPKTFGVMVFQEQLQFMYQQLTGCTGTEAEAFRRLVSKKLMDKINEQFVFFHPRAAAVLGDEDARKAWAQCVTFGQYGFNASHAVCYALIGYVCAWLKHHQPLEWWCAVLRNAEKDEIAEQFWPHCRDLVDLPDLSHATSNFEIVGDRIVSPMSLLHGIGETAHAHLMAGAPYASVGDLCEKIEAHKDATKKQVVKVRKDKKTGVESEETVWQRGRSAINRRVIYTLLIAGAMDRILPKEVRDAGVLGRLSYYEQVFAAVTKAKRVTPVPAWYGEIGALALYALRKKVLPAYHEDLRPILAELQRPDLVRHGDDYVWRTLPLVRGGDLRQMEAMRPLPQGGLRVSACAFVSATRPFDYQDRKTNAAKHAVELILDIDGESFKMVAWPGRSGTVPAVDDGSVALIEASRWDDSRPFSVGYLEILQRPVKEPKDEKKTETEGG